MKVVGVDLDVPLQMDSTETLGGGDGAGWIRKAGKA